MMIDEIDVFREIRLRFKGANTSGNAIPARALIKSLEHLQRIIHLLARFHRGDGPGQRGRAPRHFEERFALTCKLPREGSYVVPVEIGGSSRSGQLAHESVDQVNRSFLKLTRAVGQGDPEEFRRVVPDRRYQASLVKEYRGIQPSRKTGLICSIEDGRGQEILNGFNAPGAIEKLDFSGHVSGGRNRYSYIGGILVGMDFARRRLRIERPGGGILNATYSDDFEPALANHPRGVILMCGEVTYDEHEAPVSIVNVRHIVQMDQGSFGVREWMIGNVRYRIEPSLCFAVKFDPESCLYDLKGDLGICFFAEERSELADMLGEEIQMLWDEYAQEHPHRLSPEGLKLRNDLLGRFREVRDGAQAPGR